MDLYGKMKEMEVRMADLDAKIEALGEQLAMTHLLLGGEAPRTPVVDPLQIDFTKED